MSDGTSSDRSTRPPDPLVALRAADTPGWTDPIAPDPEFTRRLRDRLERGATLPKGIDMSTTIDTVSAATAPTVERPGALPYLAVRDARAAIDWYVTHLGARLRGEPIVMDDGRIGHAVLDMGGGAVYLAEEFPDLGLRAPRAGEVSVSLMLDVEDADAAVAAAERGGATVTRDPADAYGQRMGTVVDPFGHRWMLAGPSHAASAEPIRTGDIVYLSLQTRDLERAARFYGTVLGWEIDRSSRQVTNLGHRLGISDVPGYGPAGSVYCVYAVDDLDSARDAIVAAGGQAGEITEVAHDGTRVVDAVDDQGVPFSVHVPAPGEPRPAEHPSGVGEMAYLTIRTVDSARFRRFYGSVLGWTFSPGSIEDGWQVENAHPQVGVAGGAETAASVPMWSVSDMSAAIQRVRSAGGRVIDEPTRQPYGIMALCADDQDARFYLGQLP